MLFLNLIAIPNVTMTCSGQSLEACFSSTTSQVLSADNIRLEPACSKAEMRGNQSGAVCLTVDMSFCPHSHNKVYYEFGFLIL